MLGWEKKKKNGRKKRQLQRKRLQKQMTATERKEGRERKIKK